MEATQEGARPYWIPEGASLEEIPEGFRLAVTEVLEPAYRELVLAASDPLERATATTALFLYWLELQHQHELAADGWSADLGSPEREAALGRPLRAIGARQKAAGFLERLQAARSNARAAPPPGEGGHRGKTDTP